MTNLIPIPTYEELVRAIGPGFHPDTYGDDYTSLPAGLTPEIVDEVVAVAFVMHEAGDDKDPYSRALAVLESGT